MTVGGLYGVISSIQDAGDGYPTISAPGEEELEDEYPYRSAAQRSLSSDVDTLRAFITRSLGGDGRSDYHADGPGGGADPKSGRDIQQGHPAGQPGDSVRRLIMAGQQHWRTAPGGAAGAILIG